MEPKLDGLAIAARYRDGRLVQLITRGNGTAGEEVSHAIGTLKGLPGQLAEPVTVEVRRGIATRYDKIAESYQAGGLGEVRFGTAVPDRGAGISGALRRARLAP